MLTTENKQQSARLLLVGSGRMGAIRASIMYANPTIDFLGVVDSAEAPGLALANKYGVKYFKSLGDAFDFYKKQQQICTISSSSSSASSSVVDGLVIATPTFTHAPIIKEAADSGFVKGVFVEKPVDDTSEKIDALFKVCEDAGMKLCCGFQRRFDKSYVAAQLAVREGKIGKAVMANIMFADHPCPPLEFLLQGGNIFSDLLVHDADYIRWCLHDEVASVYATGTSSSKVLRDANVHDNATVVLTFKETGAVITLSMSRSASYGYDQRCEIFGTDGMVNVHNHPLHSTVLSDASGITSATYQDGFATRFHEAFKNELECFKKVILDDDHYQWSVSREDCIAVQKIADAAIASCESNSVIQLL